MIRSTFRTLSDYLAFDLFLRLHLLQNLKMPSIKVIYFPARGRAEATRLALAYTGQEFEDVRLPGPALFGKYLASCPYKQFPLLEVDGKILAQSNCMLRYAAASLRPADAFEACRIDSICDQAGDVAAAVYGYAFCQDPEQKEKLKKELHTEKLPKLLGGIVTQLGEHSFFGGDKPCAADFAVYALLESAPRFDVDLSAYPTLLKHQETVRALPELAAYFAKRAEVEAAEAAPKSA